MKTVHAFTETNAQRPGYISIKDEAGKLTVSVRTRGGQVPSIVEMNPDQLEAMARDVLTHLGVDPIPPLVFDPKPAVTVADSKPVKTKDKA